MDLPYVYRWDRHGRKGQPCAVLCRGKMNSCLVRGSLCDRCNQGIGFFLDDPEYLRRAADYLDKFKQTTGKGDIPADLQIRQFPTVHRRTL